MTLHHSHHDRSRRRAQRRSRASRSSASGSSRSPPRTPPAPCATRSRSATATSTPPRCTATSAGVGEAVRASGLDRADVFVTSKLSNRFHRPDDARRAFDQTLVRARLRLRRPLPHPLAAAHALRRRLRLDLAGRSRSSIATVARARSASRTSRSTTSSGSPPRPTWCRRSTRSSCTPTSATPRSAPTAHAHGIATEAWSPIAQGAVLDDPAVTAIADSARQVAGAGRPALAHPARQHRLPEVHDPGADQRELRALRLRARARRRRGDRRARPRRGGAARARTPTRSPTSPTDAGLSRRTCSPGRARERRWPPRAALPRRARAPRS